MRSRLATLSLSLVLLVGCDNDNNSWDRYARSLTTKEPTQSDVVGSYILTNQTITTNGMTALQGKQCQLDLRPDGSFVVTNYPIWTNVNFVNFLSTTGHWHSATVGLVYDNQSVWGLRFSETDPAMDMLSFTGKAPPYGLLMTYGDPDENTVMIFEKKK